MDEFDYEAVLRKVVSRKSRPGRDGVEEFVYAENGELIFYFSHMEGCTCGEERVYFKEGRLIRLQLKEVESQGCEEPLPNLTWEGSALTDEHQLAAGLVLKHAHRHRQAFDNLYEELE